MANIIDALQRTISIDQPPRRVISLIPSITEALFDLGLGDAVAGVTIFCSHPEESVQLKPKVGGQKNPDFEKIRALNPDLIIANVEENKPEHIEELCRLYPVFVTYPRKFIDTKKLLEDIGTIFNKDVQAYVHSIENDFAELQRAHLMKLKTLYLIWRQPWMSVNRDTFIHDVLQLHGMENVCADATDRYPTITMETIERLDPDVIILPDEPFRFREKHLKDFAHLSVGAVQRQQIFLIDGTYFCWYGTRTARASAYIYQNILNKVHVCA